MEDIYHPVLNNNSIFKIYQSKNESFLYSVLAAIYSKTIDRRLFHLPNAYIKYKKKLNLENLSFPMKNKNIKVFLQNNPKLNLRIRLFDSIIVSNKDMRIYENKIIGKGKVTINILFHKSYKDKKHFITTFG